MANLPESPQWEDGIYQIEVSDPVLGGPDGISNRQAKQLASRTSYLKQKVEKGGSDLAKHIAAAHPHTQYAPKASPAFTGTPTAPTPVNKDNSKKLATTEFVARAIAVLAGTAPETLDTLKDLADALGNDPNFATTVLNKLAERLAKDQNGADIPEPTLFVKNLGLGGIASAADITAGTVQKLIDAAGLKSFLPKRSFAANDYIRIPDVPGGLIIQWGIAHSLGANETRTITFPFAYPAGVKAPTLTADGAKPSVRIAGLGAATFQIQNLGTAAQNAYWHSIGF